MIEDDQMVARGLIEVLKRDGGAVDWSQNGHEGAEAATLSNYDLILLDLGLPGMSGFDVLKKVRDAKISIPVIILTAKDALDDRVRGLDLGADDYMVKPFAARELLARIRAVLRRKAGATQSVLHAGDLSLDIAEHRLSCLDRSIILSAREFALMRTLMERPGKIMSRAELEDKLYNWDSGVESNAIDFLIHSIRRKMGASVIRNIRGAGWLVLKDSK